MKVLYIVTAYDRHPGDGITPWLVETIHRLQEQGVDVEVLAPSYRGLESGEVDGVMVHRFRYAPARLEALTHDQHTPDRVRQRPLYAALIPGYVVSGVLAARRLAASGEFDAVHVHWPLPHAIPGWAARRKGGIPLVVTFHGVEITFARNAPVPFLVPFLQRVVRSADAVTANSTYTAGLIRGLHDRSVDIIPFGTTVGAASPVASAGGTSSSAPGDGPDDVDASEESILFVGRLVERKGVQHLIEAMGLLRDRPVRLHVVGKGPMGPALEAAARAHGVDDRITFHGFVPPDELATRLASCSVFVLPAVYDAKGDVEGLGVVLVEALSYHRPVVASRAGGIVDVIRHEETGLLVPPGDAGALAGAIRRLLENPSLARELAEAGYRHVQESYSWSAIVQRLGDLYRRVAEEHS